MKKQEETEVLALETLGNAPPSSQLSEPLDYIFAEHFRQRVLCNALDEIADQEQPDRQMIEAVLRFLRVDFAPHMLDEEHDLFPMLRRRAEPEDRIDDVIGQLTQEHAADRLDAKLITEGLAKVLAGKAVTGVASSLAKLLHRFAENERNHLTLENAIILPLARIRLTADDVRNLAQRMAARRGVDLKELGDAV
ncbi:hemerythrin domain-containing protein [Anderseniella sp. Alg231-50]|uniref:hemerythrin domain-containing protein n=1 Tax=Anderseniella sp. Alg231-50 TaxID=1922226 RepID=UPI000D5518A8